MVNYSLEMFGKMFADRQRHDAYAAALTACVKPGDVVLDIGTGVGVYAMLAAKLGARRVFAVESNPFISLGPRLAATNGMDDRIEFIEAMSTEIDLPEPVDVIVADLRGVLPYHEYNIESLRDARERFLKPDGVMIPTSDRIFAALASNPLGVRHYRDVWIDNPFGLDLSDVVVEQAHSMRRDRVKPEDLMSEPIEIAHIDYSSTSGDHDVDYHGGVTTIRAGTAHGLSVWFEATALPGITYSTGPFSPPTVYGMAFLPFAEPVELDGGTEIDVELAVRRSAEEYTWSWGGSKSFDDGHQWAVRQSSFQAAPLDIARLRRRQGDHRIENSRALEADQLALSLLANGATLAETAGQLTDDFADVVESDAVALTRVADLAERYG